MPSDPGRMTVRELCDKYVEDANFWHCHEDCNPPCELLRMSKEECEAVVAELERRCSLPPPPPADEYAKHVCDERCLGDNGHHAWPSPDPEPPIEQVRAELAAMGIDTGPAVKKVQDAVRRHEPDADAIRLAERLEVWTTQPGMLDELFQAAAATIRRMAGTGGA